MNNIRPKYVTLKNKSGMDYRSIAEIMTSKGDKMNHATVRNIVNKGLIKVVKNISREYNRNISDNDAYNIAKSPDFQIALKDVLESE